MSPGTRGWASTTARTPPRSTVACSDSMRRMASSEDSALPSCKKPISALITTAPQQHARVQPVPQRGGDHGGHQHHVNQDVVKLQQQPQPHRAFALLRQAIRGRASPGAGRPRREQVPWVAWLPLPLHSGGAVQAVPGSAGAGRGRRRGWRVAAYSWRWGMRGACAWAFDGDGSHHFAPAPCAADGPLSAWGRPRNSAFSNKVVVRWSFMLGWLF